MCQFKVGYHVFLTNAGLAEIPPDKRDKLRGTLRVAEINGDMAKVVSEKFRVGVKTNIRNLMHY
jgi:hypothetical protein